MTTGRIFAIEEFSLHDGPGIRTTIFLKGCPLSCMWCHNPEGISFDKEMLISQGNCEDCGSLIDVRHDKSCSSCGAVIQSCSLRLRKICGQEIDATDLADMLLKNKVFFDSTEGGITISGGEPLAQSKFLIELLDKVKPLHRAIETSGYAPSHVFKEVIDHLELVMIDIKHADRVIHKQVTGVDHSLILNNLEYLCRGDKKFIVRIPLIPGINDTRTNMEQVALLLKDAEYLERVELLPYHMTAGAKYQMLGREYNPAFDTQNQPQIHQDVFQKYNIRSVVL